jgi:ubiquinol-cytochrome c reductase cytochrome c subunit
MSIRTFFAATVLLSLISCTYLGGRTEPYRPPAAAQTPIPDTGRELYLRDCAWCHGSEGGGTDRGPDLITGTNGPAFVDFVLSTGRMPIDHPLQRVTQRDPIYSREEIEKIVDFSRTLDAPGPEIPIVDPDAAHLVEGQGLYQKNCAACHSTTGIGGALTQGRAGEFTGAAAENASVVAPPVIHSSPTEVAEAIRVGPGTMPVFDENVFDTDELNANVSYVDYLRDPADRGGAPVGRVGPVVEGAIGWIVGLGLLLLFVRWIGTKRGEL